MLTGRIFLAGGLCLAALASTACSESGRRLTPSGPSPVQAATGGADRNTATGVGLSVAGSVQDRDVVTHWAAQVGWDAVDFEAQGSGEITAVTGSCLTKTFTILTIPVTTTSTTAYEDGTCADLVLGREVDVRALLVNTNGVLSVVATRIEFEGGDSPGNGVSGEGTVASLFGTCPDLRMVIHGMRVTTNSSTSFGTAECGNLRAGTKVRIDATTQSDGSFLATTIRIVDQPGGKPVDGEGNVGGVKGTCPTLTMVVSGHPVMTTSSTKYTGGTCSDLRPGARIVVRGTIDGGSVLATEITIR
jgi:hypothetical protein